MKHILENDTLLVEIKHQGGELCRIFSKETQQEYMWNGDAKIWGSTSPLLFPIIGALKNNQFTHQGKTYTLPKHGILRNSNDFTLVDKTKTSVTLKHSYSDKTLSQYPFKYEFLITFSLDNNKINLSHTVKNHGSEDMYFSLGAHPAFKCPLQDNESYEDYYISFDKKETASTYQLSSDILIIEETIPVLDNTYTLPLHPEIFSNDALMFKHLKSRSTSLKNKANNKVITLNYPDFKYLGLWAKPHAEFVCIEPWMGINDAANVSGELKEKEGMETLASNNTFTTAYSIEINEN